MANNALVTPRMITFKFLDGLLNNQKVVVGFNTEWAREFGNKGRKIGDTLQIRRPTRWLVKSGAAYQEQSMVDTFVTARITRHRHIGVDYGAFESTLSLDDMYNRYFKEQETQLSNQVDDEASEFAYLNTNAIVGQLGTNPSDLATSQAIFLDAYAQLLENGCDPNNLTGVFWPRMAAAVMKYFNTNFNPQSELGRQWMNGQLMSNLFGFKNVSTSQNIRTHTCGTFTGTPLVNGASVDGDTTIVTDNWTAGDTVKQGDVFKVGSVFNINPKNRRSTAQPKYLLVGADATADGGGNMTIVLGGEFGQLGLHDQNQQYANLDALPADNGPITMFPGTSSPSAKSGAQSLMFGPDAFGFLPITLPDVGDEGAFCKQATDPKTGMSVTMVRQFNAETYRRIARMDIGFDFVALYPDVESVRAMGA